MKTSTSTPRTDREVYTVTERDIGFKVVNPALCRELERRVDRLTRFIEALPCPEKCQGGSIISTGPDPQNDPCPWCADRYMLLQGDVVQASEGSTPPTITDTMRLDFMATKLHRIGEHYGDAGKVDCHAWAIASAKNDLRGALDAAMEQLL